MIDSKIVFETAILMPHHRKSSICEYVKIKHSALDMGIQAQCDVEIKLVWYDPASKVDFQIFCMAFSF